MSDSGAGLAEMQDDATVRLVLVSRALTARVDPAEMVDIVLNQGRSGLGVEFLSGHVHDPIGALETALDSLPEMPDWEERLGPLA